MASPSINKKQSPNSIICEPAKGSQDPPAIE